MGTREGRDTAGRRPTVADGPAAPAQRRATSVLRAQAPVAPPSVTVTAEIPVVAGLVGRRGGAAARPSREHDYSGPRRPAPYLVRLAVWLLLFVLLLMLGGVAVEHYHPTWLDTLRNHAVPGAPAQGTTRAAVPASSTPGAASGFRELSHTPQGATYAVPATSYSIVLTTTAPCWTEISTPAGSKRYLFAETVEPSASPKSFAVSGSSTVVLAHRTTSIGVEIHSRTVGTIDMPAVGYSYSFVPRAT